MPHIEVIPVTHGGSAPAPGWAYVLDIGYDPSKAAINPTGRKRNAARQSQREADAYNAGSGGNAISDLPVRQQTAILKRIAELDRDNQKDVALPQQPAARGGPAGGASKREREGRKMTPAVRKILQSGRTFAHWLADEEALAAQRTGAVAGAGGSGGPGSQSVTAAASPAPSSGTADTATVNPKSRKRSSMGAAAVGRAAKRAATATNTESAPATPSTAVVAGSPVPPPPQQPVVVDLESGPQQDHGPADDDDDDEPLLRPTVPSLPSEQEIQTLLAHPPLPFSAARAAPPSAEGPSRRLFCEICGYWGRVRCLRCAARICGLECKKAHDETSCLRM